METLRHILRPQRHEWDVAFAHGGEAALALMEAASFDVIVSALRMPGIDGAALLDRVRKEHPQVVRIILSGSTELSTALRVVPIAHQFLAKPCDIKTLRVAVERACHLKALLHDNSIRRTVGGLEGLPSVPRTYHALTLALADPDTSIEKIARIVELDLGISAKILQLVNSAFFGAARSITNIQSAVGYLGISTLKSLVLSEEVFRVFAPKGPIEGFSMEALQSPGVSTFQASAAWVRARSVRWKPKDWGLSGWSTISWRSRVTRSRQEGRWALRRQRGRA